MPTPEDTSVDLTERPEEYRLATMADLFRGRGVRIGRILVEHSPFASSLTRGSFAQGGEELRAPLAANAIWRKNLEGHVYEVWEGRADITYRLPGNYQAILHLIVKDQSDIEKFGIMVEETGKEGVVEGKPVTTPDAEEHLLEAGFVRSYSALRALYEAQGRGMPLLTQMREEHDLFEFRETNRTDSAGQDWVTLWCRPKPSMPIPEDTSANLAKILGAVQSVTADTAHAVIGDAPSEKRNILRAGHRD